jgi:hypothetical protein
VKTISTLKYAGLLACAFGILAAMPGQSHAANVSQIGTIPVPGTKFDNFDISNIDPAAGQLYISDRSNAGVDVIDTHADKFLYRVGGFVGSKEKNSGSGPDGVVAVPEMKQIWAGDGDSTLKVIDNSTPPGKLIATVPTGGKKRVDEMAYDARDGLVVAANNADEPAFMTLFSTKDHKILAKVIVPEASDGIEQPEYVADTGMFYVSVPAYEKSGHGAVAVFNPITMKVVKFFPINGCEPSGLVHGPGSKLLVGCAGKKGTQTVVLDYDTGKTTSIPQVSGEDEVAYNPTVKQFYTASRDWKDGPVLGVIDATTDKWIGNLQTDKGAHSVAVDDKTNKIFVPIPAGKSCPNGCVAVFQAK